MPQRISAGQRKITEEKWRERAYIAWALIGAVILLLILGAALNLLAVPVGIVVWTVILVFCLHGPVNALESMHVPRSAGTALSYLLLFGIIAVLVVLASSPFFGVSEQFVNLAESIPGYINQVVSFGNDLYSRYPDVFQNPTIQSYFNDGMQSIGAWFSTSAQSSAQSIFEIGTGIANSFMIIGFAMVVAFWILMDLPAMGRETKRLISPAYQDDADFFYTTFTRVMGGYIQGTLVQCGLIAAACAVAFTLLGVPNALAIAIITGLLNIIPVVGPWLGGALAAIAALFAGPIVAVLAIAAAIIIQQIVYTFISPKIMSSSVDVHPALVIIAMMVGSSVGGALSGLVGSLAGMLISIPAAAVLKSTVVYYFEKRTKRQLVSEDGVFFKGVPSADGMVDPARDATSPKPDPSPILKNAQEKVSQIINEKK